MSSNKEYYEEQGTKAFHIGVSCHQKSHSLFTKSESKRAAVTNSKNSSNNNSTKNSRVKTNRNEKLTKEGRISRLCHEAQNSTDVSLKTGDHKLFDSIKSNTSKKLTKEEKLE